jgi:hypothetical protein
VRPVLHDAEIHLRLVGEGGQVLWEEEFRASAELRAALTPWGCEEIIRFALDQLLGSMRSSFAGPAFQEALRGTPGPASATAGTGSMDEASTEAGEAGEATGAPVAPAASAADLRARGRQKLEAGDPAGCREDLTRALALDPEDAAALWLRGVAHFRLGDHSAALDDFHAARRGYPVEGAEAEDLALWVRRARRARARAQREAEEATVAPVTSDGPAVHWHRHRHGDELAGFVEHSHAHEHAVARLLDRADHPEQDHWSNHPHRGADVTSLDRPVRLTHAARPSGRRGLLGFGGVEVFSGYSVTSAGSVEFVSGSETFARVSVPRTTSPTVGLRVGGGALMGPDDMLCLGPSWEWSFFEAEGGGLDRFEVHAISFLLTLRALILRSEDQPGGILQVYASIGFGIYITDIDMRTPQELLDSDDAIADRDVVDDTAVDLGLEARFGLALPLAGPVALFVEYRHSSFQATLDVGHVPAFIFSDPLDLERQASTNHFLCGFAFQFS